MTPTAGPNPFHQVKPSIVFQAVTPTLACNQSSKEVCQTLHICHCQWLRWGTDIARRRCPSNESCDWSHQVQPQTFSALARHTENAENKFRQFEGNKAGWRGPWAVPLLKGDTFGDRNTEAAEAPPGYGNCPKRAKQNIYQTTNYGPSRMFLPDS